MENQAPLITLPGGTQPLSSEPVQDSLGALLSEKATFLEECGFTAGNVQALHALYPKARKMSHPVNIKAESDVQMARNKLPTEKNLPVTACVPRPNTDH